MFFEHGNEIELVITQLVWETCPRF